MKQSISKFLNGDCIVHTYFKTWDQLVKYFKNIWLQNVGRVKNQTPRQNPKMDEKF